MANPSVVQGLIETLNGKGFELDSTEGSKWLDSIRSFRYVPSKSENRPYTVRRESGKGGSYWYGYRRMAGTLHKRYICSEFELTTARLEEIAETLNTPPKPKVTDKVTEVTETNHQVVTDKVTEVTDKDTADRLTALESQLQALQESLELQVKTLQESLEGLRRELPGKLRA
ncbi:hypothetical protein Q5692_33700 [Microcoleus sp. C2C3]|uniref:hypothetical protein n=1 Tax=unclassified Microcoleus TaxID=2642155 RepID=UPI002FD59C60